MLLRLLFACALVIAAVSSADAQGKKTVPPAGSNCETLSSCHSECSAGNQASCVIEASYYRDGVGVAASKAKAAAILKNSCDKYRHPRACFEYGFLLRLGWMFEVERDADGYRDYGIARTRAYAVLGCPANKKGKDVDWDACLVSAELAIKLLDIENWPDVKAKDAKGRAEAVRVQKAVDLALSQAREACKAGHGGACQWLLNEVEFIERYGYTDKADAIKTEADKAFENACEKGDGHSCTQYARDVFDSEPDAAAFNAVKAKLTPSCKRGHAGSCFLKSAVDLLRLSQDIDTGAVNDDGLKDRMQDLLSGLLPYCHRIQNEAMMGFCDTIADLYLDEETSEYYEKFNPSDAVKMYRASCSNGYLESCNTLSEIAIGQKSGLIKASPALVLEAQRKVCSLSDEGEKCDLCSVHKKGPKWSDPKANICRMRLAWKERLDCDEGEEDRCEVLATMYEESDGVAKSVRQAVSYYRLACDSALKSSCSKLKALCDSQPSLSDDENCNQSLIHTDVFYEAEWQFRQTGSARVLQSDKDESPIVPSLSVEMGATGGTNGVSLKRGSLDADLVFSIVLDRARQAAIRLVVRELKKARRRKSVPVYLDDLLVQASMLLSDESSMRREKFQDLAMTVVRAFVASNLGQTVFATNQSIVDSNLWAQWATESKLPWKALKLTDAELLKLRGYITNWIYYGLSSTKVFGRPGEMKVPACPFKRGASKDICQLLTSGTEKDTGDRVPNHERLSELLKIDAMLEGLSLAKSIREQGSIDLRRLIEAIGHSETIADFEQTPGLKLEQWKKELGNATEVRLRDMRSQLKAARTVLTKDGWARINSAEDLRDLRQSALVLVGTDSSYLAFFDSHNVQSARAILSLAKAVEDKYWLIAELKSKLEEKGGFGFGGSVLNRPAVEAEIATATNELAELKKSVVRAIKNWDDAADFLAKIADLRVKLDALNAPMMKFRRSIVEIETILSRYKPPRKPGADITVDVKATFEIAHVPLYALPELLDQLKSVATNLKEIDRQLAPVFPGAARPKLKFAVSAVVRLLGFLDMMERVARTARLNQTCGDVMSSLRLLGRFQNDEFTAPLFDVMDPILHAIKTHEPMGVELLYAVISEVRLDSLISSLGDTEKKPCNGDDGGYECWTFKIIHSLQESVVRNGDSISLDGGAFAKRLASHGDDFRRRHKWRGYFHLTVGLGGLYSTLPDAVQSDGESARTVPLVGEQIGFGWASPTFWDEAMTFKAGVYGSGILYHLALDTSESNAIMVSPFVALDMFDLLELYAGPMALVYPPTNSTDASLEWGVAAGVTVPLSAYLDRL